MLAFLEGEGGWIKNRNRNSYYNPTKMYVLIANILCSIIDHLSMSELSYWLIPCVTYNLDSAVNLWLTPKYHNIYLEHKDVLHVLIWYKYIHMFLYDFWSIDYKKD